jgi:hypothetical protein
VSSYRVAKLLHHILQGDDPGLAVECKEGSPRLVDEFGISPTEAERLQAGDVRYFYKAGVHPLLLVMAAPIVFNLDPQQYMKAIIS